MQYFSHGERLVSEKTREEDLGTECKHHLLYTLQLSFRSAIRDYIDPSQPFMNLFICLSKAISKIFHSDFSDHNFTRNISKAPERERKVVYYALYKRVIKGNLHQAL